VFQSNNVKTPGFYRIFFSFQLFVLGGFAGEEMEDMYGYKIQDKVWRQILPGREV
jgi:hypothetical protein